MSKFCTSCGAELNDNATFCTSCGAQLGGQPQGASNVQNAQNTQNPQQGGAAATATAAVDGVKNAVNDAVDKLNKSPYKKFIVIGAAGVVLLIVLIILLCAIFGGGWKKPIKNWEKVLEKGDGKAIQNCFMFNEDIRDDDDFADDCDDLAEDLQSTIEDHYGDDLKISLDIKEKKALKKGKIEDINEALEDRDFEKEVSKGYKVKVKCKIEGDKEEDTKTLNMIVVKYDGKWYVYDDDLYTSFVMLANFASK